MLRRFEVSNPGLLKDPDRVWNMDETSIDAEHGKREKVYGSSSTHHGGFRNSDNSKGSGRHVTAVIVVSPPFLVISRKRKYADWFEPLPRDLYFH